MCQRGYTGNPSGKGFRAPSILDQISRRFYQHIIKSTINLFSSPNKISPTHIPPYAQCPAFLRKEFWIDPATPPFYHLDASRPLPSRFNVYFIALRNWVTSRMSVSDTPSGINGCPAQFAQRPQGSAEGSFNSRRRNAIRHSVVCI